MARPNDPSVSGEGSTEGGGFIDLTLHGCEGSDLEDTYLKDEEDVRGDEGCDHVSDEEDKKPTSTSKRQLSTSSPRACEADNEAAEASHCPSDKKRKVTGVARPPLAGFLKYNTKHYKLYDPTAKNVGVQWEHAHANFKDYDSYTLFMIPTCRTASSVPDKGVRLDDRTVALIATKGYTKEKLNSSWRADFDVHGMVRATRVPLGHAAKVFCREGDVDLDGHALTKDEEGYYYQWYSGLQLLCGHEGLNAGRYLQRPSGERIRVEGLGFKRGYKAVVQLPPGHRDDGTFRGLPDYAMLPVEKAGETTKAFTVKIDGKWMNSSSSYL